MDRHAGRWEKLCGQCLGDKCDACNQNGWTFETTPPAKQLSTEGREIFQAYRLLKEYGAFPVPGAQSQQAAVFLEAVHYCDLVHSAYAEKKKREQDEKDRQANKKVKLLHEFN